MSLHRAIGKVLAREKFKELEAENARLHEQLADALYVINGIAEHDDGYGYVLTREGCAIAARAFLAKIDAVNKP